MIAGGVESMTRAPYIMLKTGKAVGPHAARGGGQHGGLAVHQSPMLPADWTISLGQTAERVAKSHGISRREQEEFAVESQRRAQAALAVGRVRRRDRAGRPSAPTATERSRSRATSRRGRT